ncbi:MAG: phosphoribosylaminoimidazolesuccinocarboxamide synthase [Actinomycetota bacterium]
MGAVRTLSTLDLGLDGRVSGKVREAWSLGNGRRLLVTTDRISAFDRILGTVPHKGQVLNQLAAWWFARTADVVANHLIEVPDPNAVIAVEATPLPVEVVVRGRLTGSTSTSLLPRYLAGERMLYGHHLPDGLAPHGPLPEPLITPTTKAADGEHDRPITSAEVVADGLVDEALWHRIQDVAMALFERGRGIAADAGFVLADTKYEFGLDNRGELLLIDEVHTPDSSRYWAVESLEARLAAGEPPDGFDKEPVRLALSELGYRGDGPPPALPPEVVAATTGRYITLFEAITGTAFEPGAEPVEERLAANLGPYLRSDPAARSVDDTRTGA